MKLINLTLFLSFLFFFSCSKDDSVEQELILDSDGTARVVGYLPQYKFDFNNNIDYCKLTHLNLAFANPGVDGKLIINEIVSFVVDNNFDGVDVDLEWQYVTPGYSPFVIQLKTALSAKGKGMTAALPGTTRYNNITDEALQTFDFINLMAYDFTGPWNPTVSGQHSSYNHSLESINFWKYTVGIPSSKLTLGVPFYGYDFTNSSKVTSFSYRDMVNSQTSNADIDNVGLKFYNGRPTIKSKVKLASEQVSGIMIWELGQDSFSEYSLLKTIHNEYKNLGFATTELCLD